MRRILVYIEPVTERSDPLLKRPWLDFAARIAEAVFETEPDAQIACIVSDALGRFAGEHPALANVRFIEVAHQELIPRFARSGLDLTIAWYRDDNEALSDEFSRYFRGRVGALNPDICITFSPAPFLASLFPDAKIFHFELGAVSRAPFPSTAYLDGHGMFRCGFPFRHPEIPLGFDHEPSLRTIGEIADRHRQWAAKSNPFSAVTESLRLGSRPSILVALQHAEHYAFAVHSEHGSQYDLLLSVLDNAPDDCAVLVTEHPNFPVLTPGAIGSLKLRYRNFVFDPAFRQVAAASHYLAPLVDAVISVDSSVGLQALFWGKRLITTPRSNLAPFANGTEIAHIPEILCGPHDADRGRRVAAWYLTRYCMPFQLLFSDGLLLAWMDRLAQDADTEDPYRACPARLEDIGRIYHAALDESERFPPAPITTDESLQGRFAQLFVDRGDGFHPTDCHSIAWVQAGTKRFRFRLQDPSSIRRLRFDPINDYCITKLFSAAIVAPDGSVQDILSAASHPGAIRSLAALSYPTVDPQMVFEVTALPDDATFEIEIQLLEHGPAALAIIASQCQALVQRSVAASAPDGSSADSILAELRRLRSDIESLRSQTRADEERRAAALSLDELHRRHSAELATARTHVDQLRHRLALEARITQESRHLLAAARRENESLAAQLADGIGQRDSAERSLLEARTTLQRRTLTYQSNLAAASNQIASLEQALAQMQAEDSRLTARIEAMESENAGLQAERDRLAGRIEDLASAADSLRHQRDEEQKLMERLERELEQSQNKRRQAILLLQQASRKRSGTAQDGHAKRNNDSKLSNR